MTDYKQLCVELTEALCGYEVTDEDIALIDRVRAALAEPEPEEPTDEEIMDLMPQQMRDDFAAAALQEGRRPKPESSAEVALNLLDDVSGRLDAAHENGIRRALERLQELEDSNPKLPTPVATEPPTEIVFEGTRYTRADLVSLEERGGVIIGGVEYLPSKAD